MTIYENGKVGIVSNNARSKGAKLSQWYTKDGYLRTKLESKSYLIHYLVCRSVYGERPAGLVINHKDGNKLNNHPDNLEYCTVAENIAHAVATGLHVANDPKRNGRYKDGRALDRAAYKHQHYLDNIEVYKARARAFYEKKLLENAHGR
jgi:hypothetical protein